MGGSWSLIITTGILVVLAVGIVAAVISRFVFKIKKDYELQSQVQKNLPKWFNYSFIILMICALIVGLMLKKDLSFMLILLFMHSAIIGKLSVDKAEDKKQRYYLYGELAFNSILVVLLVLGNVVRLF